MENGAEKLEFQNTFETIEQKYDMLFNKQTNTRQREQ